MLSEPFWPEAVIGVVERTPRTRGRPTDVPGRAGECPGVRSSGLRPSSGEFTRPLVNQRTPESHPLIDVGLVEVPDPGFDDVAQSHHDVLEGSDSVFDCHLHGVIVAGVQSLCNNREGISVGACRRRMTDGASADLRRRVDGPAAGRDSARARKGASPPTPLAGENGPDSASAGLVPRGPRYESGA